MSMKVVIAPDKFKGSLSAPEAAESMARGVRLSCPSARIVLCPVADGGEGTVEAVAAATGAELMTVTVKGPLPSQRVEASWAYLPAGAPAGAVICREGICREARTAVVEMAKASGISLIPEGMLDPMRASTVGTGELIKEALDRDCEQLVIGIGGSGTVDGGTGMAAALGYRFLDASGEELEPGGGTLEEIADIDIDGVDPRVAGTSFVVASDVANPLLGPDGAAAVYGPQKGASVEQVEALQRGLENLTLVMRERLGVDVSGIPGSGAAGGLGAGLVAFCGARITGGFDLIAELTGLEELAVGADVILTGEGAYDSQTESGKAPCGVAAMGRRLGVPVVILAGRVNETGVEASRGRAAFCILPGPTAPEEAMAEAADLVASGTARLMRLLLLFLEPGEGVGEGPGRA
jgi:glycerate 2-kinase